MEAMNRLREAINNDRKLVWLDPYPIEDNDYEVTYIEPIGDDWDDDTPIIIHYGGGSEAEVFAGELHAVMTEDEFAKSLGYDDIESAQEHEDIWDYPMSELAYVINEVNDSVAFVEVDGVIRVFEMP